MYLCILDATGAVLLSHNIACTPQAFLAAVEACREDLVVAVECMFTWYWLDLRQKEGIDFCARACAVHARDSRRQSQEGSLDAHKIAALLRGGMIPQPYVHPAEMRARRDFMRRRKHLVRTCSELIAHTQNEASHYNLPPFEPRISKKHLSGWDCWSTSLVGKCVTALRWMWR